MFMPEKFLTSKTSENIELKQMPNTKHKLKLQNIT